MDLKKTIRLANVKNSHSLGKKQKVQPIKSKYQRLGGFLLLTMMMMLLSMFDL